MLGGAWSMSGDTTFSGPFGTGLGGDVLGVSNSPKMDPLQMFATNQPGGKNWNLEHNVVGMGKPIPMQSGFSPQQLMALMGSYNTFLQNLGAPMPQTPGGGPGSVQGGGGFRTMFNRPDPGTLKALGGRGWQFGPYGGMGNSGPRPQQP